MILSTQHWTRIACRTGLGLLLAGSCASGVLAEPVDAVPLERPGTHIITSPAMDAAPDVPDMPASAAIGAEPALPAVTDETAPPKLGAPALPPAEPAILRVAFAPDDTAPSSQSIGQIKSFADTFRQHGGRVTLKAYAGAVGDVSTNARRLSLKRVLAVREILLAQGISADRLNVRALGGARDAGPLDRVDIVRAGG